MTSSSFGFKYLSMFAVEEKISELENSSTHCAFSNFPTFPITFIDRWQLLISAGNIISLSCKTLIKVWMIASTVLLHKIEQQAIMQCDTNQI